MGPLTGIRQGERIRQRWRADGRGIAEVWSALWRDPAGRFAPGFLCPYIECVASITVGALTINDQPRSHGRAKSKEMS